MDETRQQQIEALKVAGPYCGKIITAINKIIGEYSGNRLPDTDKYLESILNGLNWIFGVYNGTKELINEKETIVDKDIVNKSVQMLNKANQDNDDALRVEALKGVLSFVEVFKAEADRLAN